MAVNETYELVVKGRLVSQDYLHTLHFREVSVVVNPLQALIDAWQAAAQTQWLAAHTAAYSLASIKVSKVCGSVPLPAPVEEQVNLAGTRAAPTELLAPWLACLVRERGALAGRSRQGRFFVAGAMEGDVVTDTFIAAYLTLVTTYATAISTAFIATIPASGFHLVVHSRKLADAIPPPQCQDSSTLVTAYTVSPILTSQRSRRAELVG